MKHHILSIAIAAAFISGCSNGGSGMGAGIPSAVGHNSAAASVALNGVVRAISGPGPLTVSPAYAYISDSGTNTIYVYNFDPKTGMFGTEVGSTTSGLSEPEGACANGKDVWVVNSLASTVLKFRAPSITSSRSITTSGEYPRDCAVDPTTRNLAVSDFLSTEGPYGNVEIFKKATGTPTSVTCSNLQRYYFLAYDKKGNIFVDGENSAEDAFGLCEIPAGSTSGEAITLNVTPGFAGGVRVSGKDITILDPYANTIDQYAISGTTGTEVGSVTLNGVSDPVTDWIVGKHVLTANADSKDITSFAYPAGGAAVSTISGLSKPSKPIGITIAK
jgi:hypothetical protein